MVGLTSVLAIAVVLAQAPTSMQAARVGGRVVAADNGAPLSDARVTLAPFVARRGPRPAVLPSGPPPQAITDQDGRFVFEGVAPGTYTFDAQRSGYAPLRNMASGPPQTIQLTPGQSIDSVELRLQRGSVIAGRVFGPSGEPLADVLVIVMRRVQAAGAPGRFLPSGSQGPQQTNDLGEFRIAGLAAGEYIVAATRRPTLPMGGSVSRQSARTTIATTYYPGTTDQNGASPITVSVGAEVNNITFTAQSVPAHNVSGVVVDENGTPLAGAMVTLIGDARSGVPIGPAGSARTAADGSFSIGDVSAGSYRLNASVPVVWNNSGSGGGVVSSTSVVRPGSPQQIEVVVTDADVSGLQIVIRQPRR
jgi:protocatechuate 3,4-dioxygenase beta subunit